MDQEPLRSDVEEFPRGHESPVAGPLCLACADPSYALVRTADVTIELCSPCFEVARDLSLDSARHPSYRMIERIRRVINR